MQEKKKKKRRKMKKKKNNKKWGGLHGEEESKDGHYGICVLGSKSFGPWFAHHSLKGKKRIRGG